jgi:hypothetical protein
MSSSPRAAGEPAGRGAGTATRLPDSILPSPLWPANALPSVRGRLTQILRVNGLVLMIAAAYAAAVASQLGGQLNQDSWLALVSGREIVGHGLPGIDHMTSWTHGVHWIDQQWLAQLALYGLSVLGGLKAVAVAHAVLVVSAFALALLAARALGGSARATAWIAAICFLPALLPSRELRTQSFAFPLFVLALWLLLTDARRPSRRVFFVLPLLALWANVHGSAVVGAGVTSLAACTFAWQQGHSKEARPRWKVRALTLFAAPALCLFASPYAVSLPSYYRHTLLNPGFGKLVTEWQPLTLSALTAPVIVLALVSVWLIARHASQLVPFERLVLLLLVAAAFLALRNMPWLALGALLVLPRSLDAALERRTAPARGGLNLALGGVACAIVLLAATAALRAPGGALASRYPDSVATVVAVTAKADPSAQVFADVHFADWLLWQEPQLRGRIVLDARFELLSHRQLVALYHWTNEMTDSWRRAANHARLVVLDLADDPTKETALLGERGARLLYRGDDVAVIERPAQETRP